MTSVSNKKSKGRWNYRPDLSDQMAPFYHWPPRVGKTLRYIVGSWGLLSVRLYVLGLSVLCWFYFSPALERCAEFSVDWIAQIWLRNIVITALVAGSLHLYFYTLKKQSDNEKYDHRDLSRNSKLFHFNNQVWDNMFWVLTSAVGFWTFYESIMMWAYANGFASMITFDNNAIWFIALLFVTSFWTGFHFYWQHRMFHIPVLYKLVHYLHHKNTNVGPWSGPAMHPIEHSVWLSAVLILLLIPSHPIHALFIMQIQMITAITSHCGYENLNMGKLMNREIKFRLGDFFHQLHHRFYDCNYGTFETPWDQWFETYHDGSAESDDWMKKRRQQLTQTQSKTL